MNDLAAESFRQEPRSGRRCPEEKISDEASVCSRRSCGNRVGPGYGLSGPYGYCNDYDYDPHFGSYDDSYYCGDSGCYIVRRSVLTPYGWRIRPECAADPGRLVARKGAK